LPCHRNGRRRGCLATSGGFHNTSRPSSPIPIPTFPRHAEFDLDFAWIYGITAIVPRPVGHVGDQTTTRSCCHGQRCGARSSRDVRDGVDSTGAGMRDDPSLHAAGMASADCSARKAAAQLLSLDTGRSAGSVMRAWITPPTLMLSISTPGPGREKERLRL
jgi:hypothetical protein